MNEKSTDPNSLNISARIKSFHERHGGECVSDGAMYFYADGAMRDVMPIGVLMEPPVPSDPEKEYQLRHNQLRYHQLRHAAAVDAFNELDEQLSTTTPSNPTAAIAELKR